MSGSSKRTFGSDFKQFFLRGLVVLLPSVLTLWIAVKAYQFVHNNIAQPINASVQLAMINLMPHWELLGSRFEPTEEAIALEYQTQVAAGRQPKSAQIRADLRQQNVQQWWAERWYMQLIGLVVAIISVYIAGRLLGGFVGRRIYRRLESLITSVPIFKQVYPYVKQIVDFLFSDEPTMQFNRVVVVEYPRRGIWSVGFLTGNTMKAIMDQSGESVTVFIPSSPTPFTGYTITVPREDVQELPITVEEAMRFAVSGGVLVPDHQLIGPGGEPVAGPPSPQSMKLPPKETDPNGSSPPDGQEDEQRRDAG